MLRGNGMKRSLLILMTLASFGSSACYGRGGGLLAVMLGTAIVTAAVVSATQPPPPRVVFMPPPRPGYAWQPGYWTLQDGEWLWVDGQRVPLPNGYDWSPDALGARSQRVVATDPGPLGAGASSAAAPAATVTLLAPTWARDLHSGSAG